MDKETKIQLEKNCIAEVMEYFKSHKLETKNYAYWNHWKDTEDGIYHYTITFDGKNYKSKKCDLNDIIILRKNIEKVFKLEFEELGYLKTEATDNYVDINSMKDFNCILIFDSYQEDSEKYGVYRGPEGEICPQIKIYENNVYQGLKSENVNERLESCKLMFQVIFHEIQHHRQYMMTQLNVSSKEALMYAKEFCLQRVLEEAFYSMDEEKGNYDTFAIENNAEAIGWKYLNNIILEKSELINDIVLLNNARHSTYRYIVNVDTRDGKKHFEHSEPQERNDVATEILDVTITEDLLEKYPILQKEYHLDGTKKSTIELIRQLKSEIKQISVMQGLEDGEKASLINDTEEMYYELIYMELQKNTEKSIEELKSSIGEQECSEILQNMNLYFEKEREKKVGQREVMCKIDLKRNHEDEEETLEYYRELIDRTNKYYNKKKQFLSDIKNKIHSISPQSIRNRYSKCKIRKIRN